MVAEWIKYRTFMQKARVCILSGGGGVLFLLFMFALCKLLFSDVFIFNNSVFSRSLVRFRVQGLG